MDSILGSVFEPYFGASPFNNHVLPTWLPVFPVAVTCHQKRTNRYVLGCLVTREMPKVPESCLVLFGIMFGSRPGPTQDCWAAGLHYCSTVRLLRCRATGLNLQGLLAARLQRSRARGCGANNTPAHAKEREVNANVNSIILKSLPIFGKLFRIIEFTFAFTSPFFACAGVSFTPCMLHCSPDRQ